jgi:hypothetical protein
MALKVADGGGQLVLEAAQVHQQALGVDAQPAQRGGRFLRHVFIAAGRLVEEIRQVHPHLLRLERLDDVAGRAGVGGFLHGVLVVGRGHQHKGHRAQVRI